MKLYLAPQWGALALPCYLTHEVAFYEVAWRNFFTRQHVGATVATLEFIDIEVLWGQMPTGF